VVLFGAAFLLCITILGITVVEKFAQGGWVTVVVTAMLITACFLIRRHYRAARATVDALYRELGDLPEAACRAPAAPLPLDPSKPTAAILVNGFGGVGIHTVLNVFRSFPGHFRNVVFLSVGVVDSGEFKGGDAVAELSAKTDEMLARYQALATRLGIPAATRMAVGTEVVAVAEQLCLDVAREFPRTTFFAGKMIFARETIWHRLLHNETPLAIQERLQWAGKTMVTVPIRVGDVAAATALPS
jgi:hypothetical protein